MPPDLGKINFDEMTDDQRFALGQYFIANKAQQVFSPGKREISITEPDGTILTYQFELTDIILRRARAHHAEEERFEIIDPSIPAIGKGGFSEVLKVKGTLVPLHDGSVMLKEKKRTVKVQSTEMEKEFHLTPIHLHAKPPVLDEDTYQTYMVMRLLEGRELFDIITDDIQNIKELTTQQRANLSLKILRALQHQVHGHKRVHRDLKPQNIMINIDDDGNITVNIFDYGLSKLLGDKNIIENVGSADYASTEQMLGQETDQSTDIFSVALIISWIWKISNPLESPDVMNPAISLETRLNTLEFDFSYLDWLVNEVQELADDDKNFIIDFIEKSTNNEKKYRYTLQKAIELFEHIKLDTVLAQITGPNHQEQVKKTYSAAIEVRKALEELAQQPKSIFQSTKEIIKKHASDLNYTVAIQLFVNMLEIGALQKSTTLNDIYTQIDNIEKETKINIETLHQLHQTFNKLADLNQDDPRLKGEALSFTKEVETILGKQQKYHASLDDVVILNQRFQDGIGRLTPKIELLLLKQSLKNTVKDYNAGRYSPTIFVRKPTLSTILRIIDRASDLEKLLQTLKKENQIGFFGNSLDDYISNAKREAKTYTNNLKAKL